MEATFKVKEGLVFKVEDKTETGIFEQLAGLQDVFGETTCGLCGKHNLRFAVRRVEDSNYYEVQCQDCGGKLALSKNKKGETLYSVRKLKNGLPAKYDDKEGPFDYKTKGWHKWEQGKNPPPAAKPKK
jgi:DNA-directed RNA polymerase subunit RPC12/RpoP